MSQDRLTRIETKIDTISDKIADINTTLTKQHESLKYHIKRTDLLEEDLKPIKKTVALLQTSIKLLVFISVLATILDVAVRLWLGQAL